MRQHGHSRFVALTLALLLLALPVVAGGADTRNVTLPTGTVIPVRLIEGISSDRNRTGETFRASVDAPIRNGNRTVVPRGADAYVRLVDVDSAGKLKGRSELRLQLDRVVFGKTTYSVQSSTIEIKGSSQGKKTAKSAGIGALVGGGIGAIFGGGKGAAIGAGAGAGTGVATRALSKGKPVYVAPESLLRFRLNAPLRTSK
jgi:hypothetical protein